MYIVPRVKVVDQDGVPLALLKKNRLFDVFRAFMRHENVHQLLLLGARFCLQKIMHRRLGKISCGEISCGQHKAAEFQAGRPARKSRVG